MTQFIINSIILLSNKPSFLISPLECIAVASTLPPFVYTRVTSPCWSQFILESCLDQTCRCLNCVIQVNRNNIVVHSTEPTFLTRNRRFIKNGVPSGVRYIVIQRTAFGERVDTGQAPLSSSILHTEKLLAMAFMMPVMKNDWDIYKSNRSRRTSENSQPGRSRKVSESKSESGTASSPGGGSLGSPAHRSVPMMMGAASRPARPPRPARSLSCSPPTAAPPAKFHTRLMDKLKKTLQRKERDGPDDERSS